MGTNAVSKGPVSRAVAQSVREVRERRGLSQQQLAAALGELGRPMQATAIAKIEAGDRRVDVDDLVALALALNVSPARLIVSEQDQDASVWLVGNVEVPAWSAWQWANGQHSLHGADDDLNDSGLQQRDLAWQDMLPGWVRVRVNNDLSRSLRGLAVRVERALDHLPGGGKRSSPETTKLVLAQVRAGIDGVSQQLDLAEEEIQHG